MRWESKSTATGGNHAKLSKTEPGRRYYQAQVCVRWLSALVHSLQLKARLKCGGYSLRRREDLGRRDDRHPVLHRVHLCVLGRVHHDWERLRTQQRLQATRTSFLSLHLLRQQD